MAPNIDQKLEFVEENEKLQQLVQTVTEITTDKKLTRILIFTNNAQDVIRAGKTLIRSGIDVIYLHQHRPFNELAHGLKLFRMGKVPILIVNDVFSGEFTVSNVEYVINYDLPNDINSYKRRISMTGRCGMKCAAISFVNDTNKPIIKPLMDLLKDSKSTLSPWFCVLHDKFTKYNQNNDSDEKINVSISQDESKLDCCQQKQIALEIRKKIFPTIPETFFEQDGDRCFCIKCHKQRRDKIIYKRGQPPKKYALPVGWVRFGVKTNDAKCEMNHVWTSWHAGFHGTNKETVAEIFKAGLVLLKPGDITMDGKKLASRDAHIQEPFVRYNKYYKAKEIFDPNQIYISPSIKYAADEIYSNWFVCNHPVDSSKKIKVQVAFQVRIKPGSYNVGQETIGASDKG
eukprot:525163_1